MKIISKTKIIARLLVVASIVTIASCSHSGAASQYDEKDAAAVVDYARQYADWLNENGISEMERQRRFCHAYSRVHELRQSGDTALARLFDETLKQALVTPPAENFAVDSH